MDLGLRDKVVLITGGAKGIGAAIVEGCIQEGALPVVVDKDAEANQELDRELRKGGLAARFLTTDLVSAENCKVIVEQTFETCGRIDALVNNAGVNDQIGLERGNPQE